MKYKRFAVLLLALTLVLCLPACWRDKGEETAPPSVSQPGDAAGDHLSDQVPEGTPSQSSENFSEGMVSTAYTKSVDFENVQFTYEVPEFTSAAPELQAVNEEIRAACDTLVATAETDGEAGSFSTTCGGIRYTFDCADGVHGSLCIILDMYPDASGYEDYMVYTVDCQAGRLMTDSEIYELRGYTAETYKDALLYALGNHYWYRYEAALDGGGLDPQDDFLLDRYAFTVSEENVAACRPYLNGAGELCVAAMVGSIAAASQYPGLVQVESPETSAYYPGIAG